MLLILNQMSFRDSFVVHKGVLFISKFRLTFAAVYF